MEIHLNLMGVLKEKTPEGKKVELPEGATVADLLDKLEIAPSQVQVITVGGKTVPDHSHPLADGNTVVMLPPVGGG